MPARIPPSPRATSSLFSTPQPNGARFTARGADDLNRARTAGHGDRRAAQPVHRAADSEGRPVRD
eukprot:11202562-Lingulodinium_polyedra.AAC.1